MHARSPSSRASWSIRVSAFDALWAALAPLLALWVRDAYILSSDWALTVALYCSVATGFSLLAFLAFRIRDQMASYFSVHDAIDIVKAVLVAELLIVAVLFTFTRLQGIPRTTPLIHALLLMAGLIGARTLVRLFHSKAMAASNQSRVATENIMIVGATRLSSMFIKILESYGPGQHKILGVLDPRQQMRGRSIAGVRVIGGPQDLQPIVDEYAVHGIETHRLIVGEDESFLAEPIRNEIKRFCAERGVRVDFVPELIGLHHALAPGAENEAEQSRPEHEDVPLPNSSVSGYFRYKRLIDLFSASILIIALMPVMAIVSLLALVDVGFPILFWQQRIGQRGNPFLIYKFRTLRVPFDKEGRQIPEAERVSWIGNLLRHSRLDELPQLLNVLVGDMSLIGPRPLLPGDQPPNSELRLLVRPGISGWAQINGGKSLDPDEKGSLDEWYVANASLRLDLRIMLATLGILLRGRDTEMPRTVPIVDAARFATESNARAPAVPVSFEQYRSSKVGGSIPLSKRSAGTQIARGK
jgi:lipopolysaccharide/colanic/teichoic acid biosynthesis glycosyltransferase